MPDVPFVGDLASSLAAAKVAAGDKYVNTLGADVARQCLDAGELDEILVCIAPVLLGDGVRLFDHPGGANIALERLSLTQVPHATNLWLRVVRQGQRKEPQHPLATAIIATSARATEDGKSHPLWGRLNTVLGYL